jgi:molybdopterin/thiamine biosynthesis adenylyltransferase
VQFLRNAAALRVVDFDRVEQRNVSAQFHGKPSVGKAKVVALQQTMQFLFGSRLDVVPHALGEANVSQILDGHDLVIDAVDHGPTRRLIQGHVRAAGIPCLHGALAADGGFGRVVWDEDFVADDAAPGTPTCEGGEHLPFVGLVAAHLAHAATTWLAKGRKIGFQISPAGAIVI